MEIDWMERGNGKKEKGLRRAPAGSGISAIDPFYSRSPESMEERDRSPYKK